MGMGRMKLRYSALKEFQLERCSVRFIEEWNLGIITDTDIPAGTVLPNIIDSYKGRMRSPVMCEWDCVVISPHRQFEGKTWELVLL